MPTPPRRQLRLGLVLALVLGLLAWSAVDQARPVIAQEPEGAEAVPNGLAPFALVELFTSEGCSSCPPADRLLGEIADEAAEKGARVFALSYHVDYWDSIGWRDPYSQRVFTVRQRRYQQIFGERGAYTPHMVVNGQPGFVGSRRSQARTEIAQALAAPAKVQLSGRAERQSEQLVLSYEVSPATAGVTIRVALVQQEATTEVASGENSGRRLVHRNVVRSWAEQPLPESGQGLLTLPWPAGLELGEAEVIVFAQQDSTWAVLGAAALELQ